MLGGTGSNVYTRALAREWSLAGHDVTVVCQERHPERYDLGGARVVVPELPGRLLPVFVLDAYEGLQAKLLQDFSEAELDAYVEANVAAVDRLGPDVLFTNHVLAVPADAAQRAADDLVSAGVKIIFNYSEALLETPADVTVHTSNPAVELLYALYFHLT